MAAIFMAASINIRGIKMKGLLSLLISSMIFPVHAGMVIFGTRIILPGRAERGHGTTDESGKPLFADAGVD